MRPTNSFRSFEKRLAGYGAMPLDFPGPAFPGSALDTAARRARFGPIFTGTAAPRKNRSGYHVWVLQAFVLLGAALWISTEALGAFGLIGRVSLIVFWLAIAATAFILRPRIGRPGVSRDPIVWLCIAGMAGVFSMTALVAALSPPNSADAMAYHMPRVVYWAEQGGVRFFPTAYLNQIMLQPFAEYAMLHLYVLTGGDRLINLVQWSASLISALAVWRAAALMGGTDRGCAIAAFFAATLPLGILASSGAKNDYFLAMWLMVAICFALRYAARPRWKDAVLLGVALGLAFYTKATAYLFAPFPLAAILCGAKPRKPLVAAFVLALAFNSPLYVRNYRLSGSPLGFDSAQADGFFRWRNETFGWRQTLSNIVRNSSDQLGARSERWNQGLYRADLWLHRLIGISPNDPATTWRWTSFGPPVNASHEANAPNRWQLAVLFLAAFARYSRPRLLYLLSLTAAFIAFCVYLKWQPYFGRVLLPLFVLASPLVAVLGRRNGRVWTGIQIALVLFLLNNARPALFENWVRPLQGPRSILRLPREERYFADMTQWPNKNSYFDAAAQLSTGSCRVVGIDIGEFQLEYPLMALVRERMPGTQFVHVNAGGPSARYPPPVADAPCAVAKLTPLRIAVK